jgi:putative ABC transport system permease protein
MTGLYFKLAKRSLLKNKYYSCINVFGLVFGMLSALIIAKYIGGSLEVDRFHEKKDKIYSVTQEESISGDEQKSSKATYWGVGELINQYPEVQEITRYSYHIESLITAESDSGNRISFFENRIFSVDSAFLKIFTFPLRFGNSKTALSRPNSIVITSSASQRYFAKLNPIGRTLAVRVPWGRETEYVVTGVIEDVPQRSQFNFDFLTTHAPIDPSEFWFVPDCATYLLLKDNIDIEKLQEGLTSAMNGVPQLRMTSRKVTMSLESFATVELSVMEHILIAVGIFIVLISWVNYINQVIAQSYWRMKEIGILRVMGATSLNLKKQFIVESSLVCVTSLVLIVIIYAGIEPHLQSFTNGHLLPLIGDPTPVNFVFFFIFAVGIMLAAGIPGMILFSPISGKTLQNAFSANIGNVSLRQALVVLQFSISTVLIICVFVISNQLKYMNSKDKGIDMKDVLIVRAPIVKGDSWNEKRKAVALFKEKCKELPFVVDVASSTTVPSEEYRQETYLSLQGTNTKIMVHQNGVDDHFFDLYAVTFLAGENFVRDAEWKNKTSIILNESAARALGIVDFKSVMNAKIVDHESDEVYDLVGIVKDYHQTSLKFKTRPIAFKFNTVRGHFSLRMNSGLNNFQSEERVSAIRYAWEQIYPDVSFDHFFLEAKFAAQDTQEQYFGKLFNYFTGLSIMISCLGLFGLSLLISTKRQRDIGVRKVFGATAVNILLIFLRGYIGPLLIAVVIGSPVAYLLMDLWLQDFAYRIEIEFSLICMAWLCLAIIFIFTVSYHTIKAAVANPVSVLKD